MLDGSSPTTIVRCTPRLRACNRASPTASPRLHRWPPVRDAHLRRHRQASAAPTTPTDPVAGSLADPSARVALGALPIPANEAVRARRVIERIVHVTFRQSQSELAQKETPVNTLGRAERYAAPTDDQEGKVVSGLDPTMKTKLLAKQLRQMRDASGLTQGQVAQRADWSLAKMKRMESGGTRVTTSDLNTLLDIYDIDANDDVRRQLRELGRGARQRSWTDEFRGDLRDEFVRYLGYEASAARILKVEALMVPGLLQTEDYARALFTAATLSDDPTAAKVEAQVRARKIRQQTMFSGDDELEHNDPGQRSAPPVRDVQDLHSRPELQFMLDEAVLRRPIGGMDVMIDQLEHLRQMTKRDNISIQVVPITAGGSGTLLAPFTILEFADADPMLYIETPIKTLLEFEGTKVSRYHTEFRRMSMLATPPERFSDIVDIVIEALRHTAVSLVAHIAE